MKQIFKMDNFKLINSSTIAIMFLKIENLKIHSDCVRDFWTSTPVRMLFFFITKEKLLYIVCDVY